jgi:hypothetical protein
MIEKEINLENDPFGFIKTSVGTLALRHLTLGIQGEMYEEFDDTLENISASKYLKTLIKYCCVKQEHKDSDKYSLTKNEISILTKDDFEKIAKYFIENNEYLNRESETKNVEEDGETLLTTEYGKVITPKKKDESYQDYLLRLTIKDHLKTTESFKNFQGSIASFSKNLQESLKGSIDLGRKLSESAHNIKGLNIPTFEPPKFPKNIKLSPKSLEEFKLSESSSLKTFKEFSAKLEQLIQISASSTEFMAKANENQIRIADEVKTSSDTSTSLSKTNINISYIVLGVAILSFIYSIYSINEANKSNAIFVKEIILELGTINKSVKDSQSDEFQEKLMEFKKELDSVKQTNKHLNSQSDELQKKLMEFKKELSSVKQINKHLKNEVEKLNLQIKSKTKTPPNNS